MKINFHLLTCFIFLIAFFPAQAQIATPTILELTEDDHVATLCWNSKTNTYHMQYDPDKQQGIYSYKVEWGTVAEGFTQTHITPYRVHQFQPLEEGIEYMARVYSLDAYGNQSEASETIFFQHDPTRVNDMRERLNGFFDDMNTPMGAFDEKKWNQSYSGCMKIGYVSQHVNGQYHGHNVIASNHCDRGVASSRVREIFDFTDRTGNIEFDLDGSQNGREFWYLDITNANRKRDLTGHTSIGSQDDNPADPAGMLRIAEVGSKIIISIANSNGELIELENMYEDGACGDDLRYCPEENLGTAINVRRHWKVELSKTHFRIFINDSKVIDGSLITEHSPNGLEFEEAQLNWLLFSYNTPKDNFVLSMIHWDNFGFDAPAGYEAQNVVHNYTDGILGTESPKLGNEASIGMHATLDDPGISTIVIPDSALDTEGNIPLQTELMFTMQGASYAWTAEDRIELNGHVYYFPEPESEIVDLEMSQLLNSHRPYSAILDIDPNHLLEGENEIYFYLNTIKLLNIHIELSFPIATAPEYTSPSEIYSDHTDKLMAFWDVSNTVGPGIVFKTIDNQAFWTLEKVHDPTPDIDLWYVYNTPVSDSIQVTIEANSLAQLAATATAKGIAYYEVWIDNEVVSTVQVDAESPVSTFLHELTIDLSGFENGQHELYVQAYDIEGNPSLFDAFQAHAYPGLYRPTIFEIENAAGPPDLSTSLTILPTIVHNLSNLVFIVDVLELNNVDTEGNISVVISKDLRLSFEWDPALNEIGPFTLQNELWTYDDSNPSFHIWSSDLVLNQLSNISFGMEASYDPQNTTGQTNYTATILFGSGGEVNGSNNNDAETIQFNAN